jgi:hypothetical protein
LGVAAGSESLTKVSSLLADAEKINAAVTIREAKVTTEANAKVHEDNYTAYDAQVKAIERFNVWLAKNSKWPIPGIGFSDEFLTWNGRPWFDLSGTERLVTLFMIRTARNELKPADEQFHDVLFDEFAGGEDAVKAMMKERPQYRLWIVNRTYSTGQGLKITNASGDLMIPVGPAPEPIDVSIKKGDTNG